MFVNCLPNTLDTTVHYGTDETGCSTRLSLRVTSMPCGNVIRVRKYGLTWLLPVMTLV